MAEQGAATVSCYWAACGRCLMLLLLLLLLLANFHFAVLQQLFMQPKIRAGVLGAAEVVVEQQSESVFAQLQVNLSAALAAACLHGPIAALHMLHAYHWRIEEGLCRCLCFGPCLSLTGRSSRTPVTACWTGRLVRQPALSQGAGTLMLT